MSPRGAGARRQDRERKRQQHSRRRHDPPPTTAVPPLLPRWILSFEDHFAGDALDRMTWHTEFPWGRDRSSVGELQYYGDDAFRVADSILTIEAREGSVGQWRYTSGLISSYLRFAQTYGRFEMRCRVPWGAGLWPAFWLLPVSTDWPPEIDVMEVIGSATQEVSLTYHARGPQGEDVAHGFGWRGPDFAAAFHTFALEWVPDRLVWFVDGIERARWQGQTPREPMYLLLNLAVGGDWPGAPNTETRFPARFDIDYVRAWR